MTVEDPTAAAGVGALEAGVGALGANIGALGANVGALGANVGALEAGVGALGTNVRALGAGVGAPDADGVEMMDNEGAVVAAGVEKGLDDGREVGAANENVDEGAVDVCDGTEAATVTEGRLDVVELKEKLLLKGAVPADEPTTAGVVDDGVAKPNNGDFEMDGATCDVTAVEAGVANEVNEENFVGAVVVAVDVAANAEANVDWLNIVDGLELPKDKPTVELGFETIGWIATGFTSTGFTSTGLTVSMGAGKLKLLIIG